MFNKNYVCTLSSIWMNKKNIQGKYYVYNKMEQIRIWYFVCMLTNYNMEQICIWYFVCMLTNLHEHQIFVLPIPCNLLKRKNNLHVVHEDNVLIFFLHVLFGRGIKNIVKRWVSYSDFHHLGILAFTWAY